MPGLFLNGAQAAAHGAGLIGGNADFGALEAGLVHGFLLRKRVRSAAQARSVVALSGEAVWVHSALIDPSQVWPL